MAITLKRSTLAMIVVAFMVTALPVFAITTNSPSLAIHSARAYQNVLESGDLLVLHRYSLPSIDWATHTTDGALSSLVQGATTYQDRKPHSLGEAFSAWYLEPGHGFTWSTAATGNLNSNPTLFVNNQTDNVSVQFITTATVAVDSAAAQTIICDDVRDLLSAVEAQDATDSLAVGDLVTANTVTEAGTNMALLAFGAFGNLLPNCFYVGVEQTGAFNPNDPALRTGRTATVEATTLWASMDALAADWGFQDENLFAALVGLGFAGLALVLGMLFTGSALYGAAVGSVALLAGAMNAPQYLLQGVFIIAIFASIGAAAFWFRSVPR